MSLNDVLKVVAAVMVSLGGGGTIVFAMSGFLGRLWADRALQTQKAEGERQLAQQRQDGERQLTQQRQEYAQLNMALQAELDRVGLLHKLRTESEFHKLAELWKAVARLRVAFSRLPNEPYNRIGPDASAHHESRVQWSDEFFQRWREAFELWNEEALSIPESISLMAAKLFEIATVELPITLDYKDPFDGTHPDLQAETAMADFVKQRAERSKSFGRQSEDLLAEMRKYLQGVRTSSKSAK